MAIRAEAQDLPAHEPFPRVLAGVITARAAGTPVAATAAFFTRARFIDGQFPSVQFLVGGAFDGGLGPFLGGHSDKSEAAGAARGAIRNQIYFSHRPKSCEHVLQVVLG